MLGNMLVSGGARLGILSLEQGQMMKETPMESCVAVCMGGKCVFAAEAKERAVYRFDENLLLSGVYAGGPGMRDLSVSRDGERLYLLLGDADSVMMLGAADGSPMLLARAGVNPRNMRLDRHENSVVIAGGKDGSALLLCPYTLRLQHAVREEGICVDALLYRGVLCMLHMTGTMNSRLVLRREKGSRRVFQLSGMPGSLCASGNELLVSAGRALYFFDAQAMCMKKKIEAAVNEGKLLATGSRLFLLSSVEENLYALHADGWKLLCRNVRCAAASG